MAPYFLILDLCDSPFLQMLLLNLLSAMRAMRGTTSVQKQRVQTCPTCVRRPTRVKAIERKQDFPSFFDWTSEDEEPNPPLDISDKPRQSIQLKKPFERAYLVMTLALLVNKGLRQMVYEIKDPSLMQFVDNNLIQDKNIIKYFRAHFDQAKEYNDIYTITGNVPQRHEKDLVALEIIKNIHNKIQRSVELSRFALKSIAEGIKDHAELKSTYKSTYKCLVDLEMALNPTIKPFEMIQLEMTMQFAFLLSLIEFKSHIQLYVSKIVKAWWELTLKSNDEVLSIQERKDQISLQTIKVTCNDLEKSIDDILRPLNALELNLEDLTNFNSVEMPSLLLNHMDDIAMQSIDIKQQIMYLNNHYSKLYNDKLKLTFKSNYRALTDEEQLLVNELDGKVRLVYRELKELTTRLSLLKLNK